MRLFLAMRTRFAPSPTGYLHIGGMRTALFSYLIARQTQGAFLLRIEDTDRAREVPGSVEQILHILAWAGLQPDEGVVMHQGVCKELGSHGPYRQSDRLASYRVAVDQLVKDGHAYPCFCTPERLDAMRTEQQQRKQAPMYDRHCLSLSPAEAADRIAAGESHVIRMHVPHGETVSFEDDVRGSVSFRSETLDDQVLLKSDGWPTYHLAHVVDDHAMQIDLVIRGEEWLPSLPKHLLLFRMFGWQPPRYAHVPLLLNPDKSKLSKRQNAVSVQEYIDAGYLPEVLLNFLALLGWNPGTTEEVFTLADLMQQFSLEKVQKSGAVFDRAKLDWLQGQWIRKFPLDEFAARIKPFVEDRFPAAATDETFTHKASLIHERITFFHEAPDMLGFFYDRPDVDIALMANKKQKVTAEHLPLLLRILQDMMQQVPEADWNAEHLLQVARDATTAHELKLGQLLWPLRALLTGREYSPGAVEVAAVLGKEETMQRLQMARAKAGE